MDAFKLGMCAERLAKPVLSLSSKKPEYFLSSRADVNTLQDRIQGLMQSKVQSSFIPCDPTGSFINPFHMLQLASFSFLFTRPFDLCRQSGSYSRSKK